MPKALTQEEKQRRIDVIQNSLTYREAAQKLGISKATVKEFSSNYKIILKGLIDTPPKELQAINGVTMETALTPDQCHEMRKFLALLITVSKHGKVNINKFFKAYLEIKHGRIKQRKTKVTPETIEQMRTLRKNTDLPNWEIANMFGVSTATAFVYTRNI